MYVMRLHAQDKDMSLINNLNNPMQKFSALAQWSPRMFASSTAATTTGRVLRVVGPVVDVQFSSSSLPSIRNALEVLLPASRSHDCNRKVVLEVAQHIGNRTVRALSMNNPNPLVCGQPVVNTGAPILFPVDEYEIDGRVLNVVGEPVDGGPSLLPAPRSPSAAPKWLPIVRAASSREAAPAVSAQLLPTGIKAIDLLCPLVAGGSNGVFGPAGTGKSTLMRNLAVRATVSDGPLVLGGVCEGVDLMRSILRRRTVGGAGRWTACVVQESGSSPSARARVGHAAVTVAEHWSGKFGQCSLFLADMLRMVGAGKEVSAALDHRPAAAGYQPTLASDVASLQDRLSCFRHSSSVSSESRGVVLTSFQSLSASDCEVSDPAVAALLSHFDASVRLSSTLAEQRLFPAVDPLASASRLLTEERLGTKHYATARAVQKVMQEFAELQDFIAILGPGELSEEGRITVARAKKLRFFLTQPLDSRLNHAGVELGDTINGVETILRGEVDDLPDEAFYMVGTMAEGLDKAVTLRR